MGLSAIRQVERALAESRGDRIAFDRPRSLITGCLHGVTPSKYNSGRFISCPYEWRKNPRTLIPGRHQQHFISPDPSVETFVKRLDIAVAAFLPTRPMLDGKLSLYAWAYYPDMRRDVDIEIVADALQKTGLIVNDRKLWIKHGERRLDPQAPRVEFRVRPVPLAHYDRDEQRSGALFRDLEEE